MIERLRRTGRVLGLHLFFFIMGLFIGAGSVIWKLMGKLTGEDDDVRTKRDER